MPWPRVPKVKKRGSSEGPEAQLQKCFFQWLRLSYPRVHAVSFSIPNGGLRTLAEGKRQVAMGLKAGVPDILIAFPVGDFHGLFIELKWGANTLTDKQVDVIKSLMRYRYCVGVCYTYDEVTETVKTYLQGRAQDVQRRTVTLLNSPPYSERLGAMES